MRYTKWLERMTLAPFWIRYLIVGIAARILVSSVIFWLSSRGTFKSALTKTFFPFNSAPLKSPTLFFAIDTTPLTPLPLTVLTFDATCTANRGSAAANPSRRSGRAPRNEERWMREGHGVVDGEEDLVVGRSEMVVGAVAEAIVERERECLCEIVLEWEWTQWRKGEYRRKMWT